MENNQPSSPFHLLLSPLRAGLIAGRTNTLTLLARLQAPPVPEGAALQREPLHLALVLDRSGSMAGQPLEEARRCARQIVDSLAPDDRACVFAFDDEIACLAPLAAVGDGTALRAALGAIECGGSTNLHGGWHAGASALAAGISATGVHRVILLSDGCANQGETELEAITMQCRDLARGGVSTSTYGLGASFNEDLMLAMAKAGRGSAYYGRSAADLAEPFQAEFALLTSLCARGVALRVQAPEGIHVRMRNDYEPLDANGETGSAPSGWKLPDLAYGAEVWAVLEIRVPASALGRSASVQLPLTVCVEASGPGTTPFYLMSALPPLPVVSAEAFASLPIDECVARRSSELEAADALQWMRSAIAQADWRTAEKLLASAEKKFADHEWTRNILGAMRRLIERREASFSAKEAAYAAAALRRRVAERNEGPSLSFEHDVPAFLRRKSEQGRGRRM